MSPISSLLPSILLLSLSPFPPISANPAGYGTPLSELILQRRSPLFDDAGPGYPDTFTLSARAPQNTWAGAAAPSTLSPRTGSSGPKTPSSSSPKTNTRGKSAQAPGGRNSPSKKGASDTSTNNPVPGQIQLSDAHYEPSFAGMAGIPSPIRRRAAPQQQRQQGKTPPPAPAGGGGRSLSSSPKPLCKAGVTDTSNCMPLAQAGATTASISPAGGQVIGTVQPPPLRRRSATHLHALEKRRPHALRARAPADALSSLASQLGGSSKGSGGKSSGPGAGAGATKGQGGKKTSGPGGGQMSSSLPCVSSYASSIGNGGVDPCAGNPNTIMAPSAAVP